MASLVLWVHAAVLLYVYSMNNLNNLCLPRKFDHYHDIAQDILDKIASYTHAKNDFPLELLNEKRT